MPPTTLELPEVLFGSYPEVKLSRVQELDSSGEDCRYCQRVDRYIEVQAYSTDAETGAPIMVESCAECLPWALSLADANLMESITVECER